VQVEVNKQILAGVLLARSGPVGHTAAMSEHDDYSDGDVPSPLPRSQRWTWIITAILLVNLAAVLIYWAISTPIKENR